LISASRKTIQRYRWFLCSDDDETSTDFGVNITKFMNKIWTIAKLCTHADYDTVEVDESEKPHLCLMWLSHWITCRTGVCTIEKPISILSRQYRLSASHPFS